MNELTDDIGQMIEPVLKQMGYELIGVEYMRAKSNILRVYIDKVQGVMIDDCALVSEQLSTILDVEEPIKSHYHLEVSSPGIERPLFTLAHYRRFLGCQIKGRFVKARNNKRQFNGEIKAIYEENQIIELAGELENMSIPFKDIEKANLVIDF